MQWKQMYSKTVFSQSFSDMTKFIQNMSSQGLTHMTLKNFMKSALKMKYHFSSLPFKYFGLLSSITVSFSIDQIQWTDSSFHIFLQNLLCHPSPGVLSGHELVSCGACRIQMCYVDTLCKYTILIYYVTFSLSRIITPQKLSKATIFHAIYFL